MCLNLHQKRPGLSHNPYRQLPQDIFQDIGVCRVGMVRSGTHRVIRCCDMPRELISSQEAQFRACPPFFLWSFQLYPALVFLGVIPSRVPHRFHVLPRVSSAIPRDPNLHIPIVGRCPDVVCVVPSPPPGEPPPRPALRCPLNFRPFLLDVIQSRTELF